LAKTELPGLKIDDEEPGVASVTHAIGCERCRQTGYKGRIGLFEIFEIDDQVRHMVNARAPTGLLRERARQLGMRTLREDGLRKVAAGLTSVDEVISSTTGM
jgi:general secretion pathway protein E/type IV pilus assembly protein PilB